MVIAGRGPVPRDPGQGGRGRPFESLPASGYAGEYPPLPDGYPAEVIGGDGGPEIVTVPFKPETREWYETWARSPMATRFTGTDWMRLRLVLAPLVDALVRDAGNLQLVAELRLQESHFGATVHDRARLRWRIDPDDGDPEHEPRQRASPGGERPGGRDA